MIAATASNSLGVAKPLYPALDNPTGLGPQSFTVPVSALSLDIAQTIPAG